MTLIPPRFQCDLCGLLAEGVWTGEPNWEAPEGWTADATGIVDFCPRCNPGGGGPRRDLASCNHPGRILPTRDYPGEPCPACQSRDKKQEDPT